MKINMYLIAASISLAALSYGASVNAGEGLGKKASVTTQLSTWLSRLLSEKIMAPSVMQKTQQTNTLCDSKDLPTRGCDNAPQPVLPTPPKDVGAEPCVGRQCPDGSEPIDI
jgi:hypothetical protein